MNADHQPATTLRRMTVPLFGLLFGPLIAMSSPWWEDYGITEKFLCADKAQLVLERNDAQASLIAGRFRSTLFREDSAEPGIRYRNDGMLVILRGDELTLEKLPMRLQCIRTEQV